MPMPTNKDPSEFYLTGGSTGALLIHGFPGAPVEMRLIGDYLNEKGLSVLGPLLPGHGTNPEDLNRRKSQEWVDHVLGSLPKLQDQCEEIFVVGLSLGSVLGLNLAMDHDVAGLVAIAPPFDVGGWQRRLLPIAKHFVSQVSRPRDYYADPEAESRLWCYDTLPTRAAHEVLNFIGDVKVNLSQVTCPLLVVYSTGDPLAHPEGAVYLYDHVGSTDKEILHLYESGHAITVDKEWMKTADRIYHFINSRSPLTE